MMVLKRGVGEISNSREVCSSVGQEACATGDWSKKKELDAEEEEEEEEMEESSEEKLIRAEKAIIEQREAEKEALEPPEWDVDSCEESEYYSTSDAPAFSDDDEETLSKLEGWNKDYRTHKRQLIESKGFYSDPHLSLIAYYKGIHPMNLNAGPCNGKTYAESCLEMVHLCLHKYNQDKGCKVELVKLVRGNFRGGLRSQSYTTFMAREKPDGPLVEYQAKCMLTVDGKFHPVLCRPAPRIGRLSD